MLRFLIALALLLPSLGAAEFPAIVSRIIDGDTLEVFFREVAQPTKVRVLNVDTQEMGTDEGAAAKRYVEGLLVPGMTVYLHDQGETLKLDRYGRTLAHVQFPMISEQEGKRQMTYVCLGMALIASGHSAYWKKYGIAYGPKHIEMLAVMEDAKTKKLNLWLNHSEWMEKKAGE